MRADKPNILFIMADQMAAPALPVYGHPVVKAPNLEALARRGVVFENAYCNFPLCAPSRFSLLSGRLASKIDAFDNAAEFPASVPTFVHYLRVMGYRTCTSGKMHFVGPDQLHGFEERLTTDILPADFGWTADWENGGVEFSFQDMKNVLETGVCARSMQIDYDDDASFQAVRKIYDLAREPEAAPFFLMVSFSHPHDPYTITPAYWDLYDTDSIDMPSVPSIPFEERDVHSRGLYLHYGMDRCQITDQHVRNARHGYYGAISYVDDKVGDLVRALEMTGLKEDTVVIFTADHGDMMGERGMWYKKNFFEWASRVPLIVHAEGRFAPRRVRENVSLLDLFPTFLEIAGGKAPDLGELVDGQSLHGLLRGDGDGWPDTVLAEYLAEGTTSPRFMVRRGRHKYIYNDPENALLFDLVADPKELDNLSGRTEHAELESQLAGEVTGRWDPQALKRRVIENQNRHRLIAKALSTGRRYSWDFRPSMDAASQYVRFGEWSQDVEARARLAFEPPAGG